jgi:nicotinamidase/pyrazinamidase
MNINYDTDALIVIDMQNDFGRPGGALYVKDGEQLVEPIMNMCCRFRHVFFTQDNHPRGHASFASAHDGKKPFDVIEMYGQPQVLWPDHCVMGTDGVNVMDELNGWYFLGNAKAIIRKGMTYNVDSYSAFRENFGPDGKRATTGFAGMLRELGIKRVFLVGLARDYCVKFSAIDAVTEGFEVFLLDNLTKSVDPSPEAVAKTTAELQSWDVSIVDFLDMYGVG